MQKYVLTFVSAVLLGVSTITPHSLSAYIDLHTLAKTHNLPFSTYSPYVSTNPQQPQITAATPIAFKTTAPKLQYKKTLTYITESQLRLELEKLKAELIQPTGPTLITSQSDRLADSLSRNFTTQVNTVSANSVTKGSDAALGGLSVGGNAVLQGQLLAGGGARTSSYSWNTNTSKILHFSMNDNEASTTISDLVGTGNGTLVNSNGSSNTSANTTVGKIGGAISLNGSTTLTMTAAETNFDFDHSNPFTVGMWVKTSASGSGSMGLFGKLNASGDWKGYYAHINKTTGKISFSMVADNSPSFQARIESQKNIIDDSWHHVVFTNTAVSGVGAASDLKMYIDGVEQNTTVSSDSFGAAISRTMLNNNNLVFGERGETTFAQKFIGSIDDIRLYNRSITAGEISALYASGNGIESDMSGSTSVTENSLFAVGTSTALLHVNGLNGNVGIGTSTPSASLDVSGSSAIFNSSQDGSLGVWNTNATNLPGTLSTPAVVTANGYVYVLGGQTDPVFTVMPQVYYAKINANGSIGSWITSSNPLPVAKAYHSAVVYNGYMYAIGGIDSSYSAVNTVYYTKLNSDGSTGAWVTGRSLPAVREGHTTVLANGYIYVIGGGVANNGSNNSQATVYYSKINADGSLGTWSTNTNALPSSIAHHTSFYANGYIYAMGGSPSSCWSGSGSQSAIYYAKLNADGSTGTWTTDTNTTWQAQCYSSAVVSNGYVYNIAGNNNGGISNNSVYYAKLNTNGSIGSWIANVNSLPVARNLNAALVVNGYVYTFGNSPASSAIHYAPIARMQIAGSLDLLGLTVRSGGITDASGDVGGSIYAGSIYSANKLEVSGNTQLWNGLSVNGAVGIFAATSTASTSVLFNVSGTSTASLFSISGNGNVGIGNTSSLARLVVKGAGTTTGKSFAVTDSNNVERFTVLDNGNVGVGTSSPQYLLHAYNASTSGAAIEVQNTSVSGSAVYSAHNNLNVDMIVGVTGSSFTPVAGITANQAYLYTGGSSGMMFLSGSIAPFIFKINATEVVRISSTGNVGIGTTTPGQKLTVVGNAQFTAVTSGTYQSDLNLTADGTLTKSASDMRLKENLEALNSSSTLDKILQLKPYTFTWINDPAHRKDIGLIAQDVVTVFPEITFTNESDGFMGINYSRLPALLVAGLQEVVRVVDGIASWFSEGKFHVQNDICVDDICVTKEEFKSMLLKSKTIYTPVMSAPVVPTPTSSTPEITSTTTTETLADVLTTEQSVEQPVEPVVEIAAPMLEPVTEITPPTPQPTPTETSPQP